MAVSAGIRPEEVSKMAPGVNILSQRESVTDEIFLKSHIIQVPKPREIKGEQA